ncbi:permease-like cell division protein FtsX [Fusibacillus kribbianus]|uniref:Cell division protein FtsX n=1 Tax=Fusibacillus kribbianus TaxID=3044208 RepID=A0AAP4BD52_9FIRM|nr:permease-like cell division protein FtsX [Ruminococcus sp. YH-rum2234]MDI9242868.1 permease-like cell division protein FtsX [Ruminococcus sp. YH-rum2234]
MRISTLWYCIKQGFRSIRKHKLFTLASVGTMAACVFLFCIFYSIVVNVQFMVREMENTVGVTVFFDEGLSEEEIQALGEVIGARSEVADMRYVSAEEAWETYKKDYFADAPELAEGFEQDNPLANSASYELYLNDIEDQQSFVDYLKTIDGVRKVNYSEIAATGLASINNVVGYVSMGIILILLGVAVFLISNTIAITITVRKEEIKIMRMIGATNFLIRAPFVVEGIIIGLFGAGIPLALVYYAYGYAVRFCLSRLSILSRILTLLPVGQVFQVLIPVSMGLGLGIGLFGSFFSIRKHLKA